MIIKAPAKINLFLEVLNKRKDGYHNIETLFLKIGLFDKLNFKLIKKGIKISCMHPDVPEDATNLVYKAAKLLQQKTGSDKGAHIIIQKKIPVFAGLGGGSSDAAAALLGLNKLWKLGLEQKELLGLARKIGADVPVFVTNYTAAIGRARGDKLTPLDLENKFWILLVKPDISVSTKEVYGRLSSSLTRTKNDVKLLVHALRSKRMELIEKTLFNRLESAAFKQYKQLNKIKQMISAHGVRAVLMSGSGSVIFGLMNSRKEAIKLKQEFQGAYDVMVVRSL
ncbi:MAG: 4-(cytidine 5'-diphospho)-2-C-methyl-D-erythritol kinase [Candidatus Omnitrophica bacterium]|nr:4-(cytidine 5'-diphospho)-2-C-methyl-D-erythritol kinase [Candidatus Omnitrophota bacterium]